MDKVPVILLASIILLILAQIEQAFQAGYDPALELVVHAKNQRNQHTTDTSINELMVQGENGTSKHLRRKEQDFVERIIHGAEMGNYIMILGCKVSLYLA